MVADQYTERLGKIWDRVQMIEVGLNAARRELTGLQRLRVRSPLSFAVGLVIGITITVLVVGPHACWAWALETLKR